MLNLKISVITPTINNNDDIIQNIESVNSQTYKNFEHIIIDGYSDKSFQKILSRFGHLKTFKRKKKGIYDALNFGVKRSSGSILLFLGGNDYLIDKNIFFKIITLFEKNNYDLIFGKSIYKYQNKIVRIYSNSKFSKKTIEKGIMPAHTSTFFKKSIFNDIGLYDLSLKTASDFEFYARIISSSKKKKFKYLNKNITSMKIFGQSSKPYSFIFNFIEKCKALKKNNYNFSYFEVLFYSLKKIIEFKPIIKL